MQPKEQRKMFARKQKIKEVRQKFKDGMSINEIAATFFNRQYSNDRWATRRMVKRMLGKKMLNIYKFMEM